MHRKFVSHFIFAGIAFAAYAEASYASPLKDFSFEYETHERTDSAALQARLDHEARVYCKAEAPHASAKRARRACRAAVVDAVRRELAEREQNFGKAFPIF